MTLYICVQKEEKKKHTNKTMLKTQPCCVSCGLRELSKWHFDDDGGEYNRINLPIVVCYNRIEYLRYTVRQVQASVIGY